jgi:hypothetical protein
VSDELDTADLEAWADGEPERIAFAGRIEAAARRSRMTVDAYVQWWLGLTNLLIDFGAELPEDFAPTCCALVVGPLVSDAVRVRWLRRRRAA